MTREDLSKRIQSNQRVDNSTRAWCESLVDEIYDDFESRTCENCKHMNKDYKISEWQKDTHFKCEELDVIIDGLDFGCNKFERKQDDV